MDANKQNQRWASEMRLQEAIEERREEGQKQSFGSKLLPIFLALIIVLTSGIVLSPWLFHATAKATQGELLLQTESNADIAMSLGSYPGSDAVDAEDVLYSADSAQSQEHAAYAICVNGENIATLGNQQDAAWVVEEIKTHYQSQQKEGCSAFSFLEKVEIVGQEETAAVIGKDDALLKLLSGSAHKVYVFVQGDTLASVAKKFNMSQEELESVNPGVVANVGNTVYVNKTDKNGSFINAKWISSAVEEENIAFTTKTNYDSSMRSGTSKVSTKGENGLTRKTTTTLFVNGQEKSTQTKSETIKKPIQQVRVVGTKTTSSGGGGSTGGGGVAGAPSFIWPLSGRISSYYGMRNGRMHYGLDIPSPKGTPIKAAAAGTVTQARVNGNYGLMVDVNHGNGYVTRYSHMSAFNCKVGDKVSQGQTIAFVGDTGNAEGHHLHFEVRVNNSPQNPLPYLP